MISKIRQYFIDNFDKLDINSVLSVDYLTDKATSYSLEAGIADPWIRHYTDGGGIKQYNFNFTSREEYGPDTIQNIENLDFYTYLSERIEALNRARITPDVPGASRVEVLTNGYIMDVTPDAAKYQIQLRLVYTV